MKPSVLVMAKLAVPAVMEELDRRFDCHHVWQVEPQQRDAFLMDVAPRIRGVLTTGSAGIPAAWLAQLASVEIIAINGVGTDAVPVAAAKARGIVVTNTPDVLTDDVADFALTLLLAAARHLPQLDRYVRDGSWERQAPVAPAHSLRGRHAGIAGFGRIGQAIAKRLSAFGIQCRYFQPRPIPATDVPRADSLLALAEESDYLFICAPATPSTANCIDRQVMQALGPSGILINVARGSLVDETALAELLQSGALGAAALDVFRNEPEVPDALRRLHNVILTPHVASLTVETRQAMGQLAIDNLSAYFGGGQVLTPV